MAEQLYQPGDYTLNEVSLTSFTGTVVSLNNLFTEINVYEDLFSNCLTGDIVLADGLNLINNMPITGFETLTLSWSTAGMNDTSQVITISVAVYKISDRAQTADRQQTYVLHFCSPELLNNEKINISRSYNGTSEEIIGTILEDSLQSDKTLTAEPSKYRQRVVVPRWKPLKLVNWLTERSISGVGAANYVFFETTRGFKFVSVNDLVDPDREAKQNYIYQQSGLPNNSISGESNKNIDFRNITAFTIKETFNTLENIESGLYAGRLHTYDPVTKKYVKTEHSYDEGYGDRNHLEGSFRAGGNTTQFMPRVRDDLGALLTEHNEANSKYYPLHTNLFDDIKDQNASEWLLQRDSQMSELDNIVIVAVAAGNSAIEVGDLINFTLPANEPQDETRRIDEYLSGRFLITSIRHKITQDGYEQVLEFTKDSLAKALPSVGRV